MTGLVIDNFAGGGGASTGIEQALGRAVDIAINHDEQALAMHEANHPGTIHIRKNVWRVDPVEVTGGKPVELAWFSPDCKHFSKAKGGKPREKSIRDLAWVVVHWVKQLQKAAKRSGAQNWRQIIRLILLENVEEFRTWGPLDHDGQPIKERAGETFDLWCRELRKAGGKIQFRELRACDYGAPTIRKRFFMIIRFGGLPIVWPEPTHGAPDSPEVLSGKRLPWRTAAEIIDWSISCPSIFERKKELADKTLRRIAHGIVKFVLDNPKPFIVPLTHHGSDGRSYSTDAPLHTVTGAHRGEMAIVSPSIVGCGGRRGQSPPVDITAPYPTTTAKADACLVAPIFARTAHGERDKKGKKRGKGSHPVTEPFPTISTSQDSALVTAHITKFRNGAIGHDMRLPLATVTANSFVKRPGGCAPLGVVTATLAPFVSYAQQGGLNRPANAPFHTLTASDGDHNTLIAAHLVHIGNGERQGQAPRAMDAVKPLGTVVAGGVKHSVVQAFMQKFADNGRGYGPGEPLHTVMAGAPRHAVIAAHLEQANGSPEGEKPLAGRSAGDPLSTIVTKGCTQRLVTSNLIKLRGTCAHGQAVEEPLATVSAQGTHIAEVRAFLLKYYGNESEGHDPEGPLGTVTTRDRFGLVTVTIGGEEYVIVDIGMRMLTPRELFNAQGFPFWSRHFRINTAWEDHENPEVVDLASARERFDNAKSAEQVSKSSSTDDQSAPAAVHALIDLGRRVLQLSSLEKSGSDAQSANVSVCVPLSIEIASVAQMLAPLSYGSGSGPIRFARPSVSASIQAPNGDRPACSSGDGTAPPADGVGRLTVTEIGGTKSTTSPDGPNSPRFVSHMRTLSCFVADAIGSSTLAPTLKASSSVELEVRHHYIIDHDAEGRPTTKTSQVARCGNSVCPPLARALTAANAPSALSKPARPEVVAA